MASENVGNEPPLVHCWHTKHFKTQHILQTVCYRREILTFVCVVSVTSGMKVVFMLAVVQVTVIAVVCTYAM